MHTIVLYGEHVCPVNYSSYIQILQTWPQGSMCITDTFDVHFSCIAEKSAFSDRLRRVRDILSQPGTPLGNQQLMTALFDAVA